VRQALAAGHTVTAVVRDPRRLTVRDRRLVVVTAATFTDGAALGPAVAGRDAVISAVGARTFRPEGVAVSTARGILAALRRHGVRRFVAVSAAHLSGECQCPSARRIAAELGDVYADLSEMEQLVMASDTQWTLIQPPMLTDGPLTAAYRTSIGRNVPSGQSVSRADVAHAVLAVLARPETIRQSVGVAD
jgi:putative NADH-flavin reductase